LFLNRIFSGVRILKKFYKTGKKSGAHKTKEPSFGILSIAVASDRQKLGIGQILMKDAENEACRCGYRQMHLTVSTENEKAIRFYEKLGWEKRLSDGAWKGSMTKTLN
jgi:ribosomal protein S18 acetylase RimI-like enzyme